MDHLNNKKKTLPQVINFGCRLNSFESEIIKEYIFELGLSNYVVINTCAVTSEAERQIKQHIRKIAKQNPEIGIILTGCAVEINKEQYELLPNVVGVISQKNKLDKNIYQNFGTSVPIELEKNDKVRAFIGVQNGCDHECTYCLTRLARGKNSSTNADEVVQIINKTLDDATNLYTKEIVLTGINITSYLDENGNNLCNLIEKILKNCPKLQRLRLSSLDPNDVDDCIIDLILNEPKIMKHIHLSVQSGDDVILARMLRRHKSELVLKVCEKLLKDPHMILGADFIVGFPTENENHFENTIDFIKKSGISLFHIFPYSMRPNTKAAVMPQVKTHEKFQRLNKMKSICNEITHEKLSTFIGKTIYGIIENEQFAKSDNFLDIKYRIIVSCTSVEIKSCNDGIENCDVGIGGRDRVVGGYANNKIGNICNFYCYDTKDGVLLCNLIS